MLRYGIRITHIFRHAFHSRPRFIISLMVAFVTFCPAARTECTDVPDPQLECLLRVYLLFLLSGSLIRK